MFANLRSAYLPTANTSYQLHVQGTTPHQHISSGQPFSPPGPAHSAGYAMGRGPSPTAFNMSSMAGALADQQQSRGPSQTSHPDSQRYLFGIGGLSQYGPQQFQGQPPLNAANYPLHPSQYASSYQEAAAAAQAYAQIQAAQRTFSGGPSSVQSSYSNAPFLQNHQQQYSYYAGQYAQAGPAAGHAPFNQGLGQYGTEISGRSFHSGYPSGVNNAGQFLRPGFASKLFCIILCMLEHPSDQRASAKSRELKFQLGQPSVHTTRSAAETKAIWTRTLGWQLTLRDCRRRSERSLFERCH